MSRVRSTARDESLEHYLTQQGMTFDVIDESRHGRLEGEWNSIHGDVWQLKLRHKREAKAEAAYATQRASEVLIVPVLGDHAGPHGVGTPSPRTSAYACTGAGMLPHLAAFSNLDFFVAPLDFCWTILHTHEDYVLGGPYYVERAWLTGHIRNQHGRFSASPTARIATRGGLMMARNSRMPKLTRLLIVNVPPITSRRLWAFRPWRFPRAFPSRC